MTYDLALKKCVAQLRTDDSRAIRGTMSGREFTIPSCEVASSVVSALLNGDVSEISLAEATLSEWGPLELSKMHFVLEQLKRFGLIDYVVEVSDNISYRIEPFGPTPDLPVNVSIGLDEQFIFSRFAYMRRDGSSLLLESPTIDLAVRGLSPRSCSVLALLTNGLSAEEISKSIHSEDSPGIAEVLALLFHFGFIYPCGGDDIPELRTWEFHDLLFHKKSRISGFNPRIGATFRFGSVLSAPPAFKPCMSEGKLALHKPDMERLIRHDQTLTRILQERRSIRFAGNVPLTIGQLGDFLFRATNIKNRREVDGLMTVSHPYPSGGALNELEFYVVANNCSGLPRGAYHYRLDEHTLEQLDVSENAIDDLITGAVLSCGALSMSPHALILITSRFRRIQWKYEGIAYRLVLLNVGAVLQTMYLVATAMGLNPCALGSGYLDRLGQTSWFEEGTVAEFMLNAKL
jgi:oxazoline/thiazoline dehydrogenase